MNHNHFAIMAVFIVVTFIALITMLFAVEVLKRIHEDSTTIQIPISEKFKRNKVLDDIMKK